MRSGLDADLSRVLDRAMLHCPSRWLAVRWCRVTRLIPMTQSTLGGTVVQASRPQRSRGASDGESCTSRHLTEFSRLLRLPPDKCKCRRREFCGVGLRRLTCDGIGRTTLDAVISSQYTRQAQGRSSRLMMEQHEPHRRENGSGDVL